MPSSAEAAATVKLRPVLDLTAAEPLKADFMSARGRPVVVDASEVDRMGGLCLQVLLSAQATWAAEKRPFRVAPFSDGFRDALAVLGAPALITPMRGRSFLVTTKTILTIDDSRTMRDMLMLALSNAGFRVVQAVDGIHGLEVMQAETPDVIITDINMPRMDGFTVIEEVRKDERYRGTPILVLTTESDAVKKERARAAGATGWIVKPFSPEKLVGAIRRVAA